VLAATGKPGKGVGEFGEAHFIAVSPTGRVVTVHSPDPVEGAIEIADLLLATRIVFRKPESRKTAGKKRTA
jgi:hypothetical protein